jgi:hypothetical protein
MMMSSAKKPSRRNGVRALVEGLEVRKLLSTSLGAQAGIPSDPTPATGAIVTAAPGVLDWADSPNAQRYDVVQDGVDLGFTPISQINLPTLPAEGAHNWHVTAFNSAGAVVGPTWTYTVDSVPPTVSSFSAPNVLDGGQATYTFTVTYGDNNAVKLSTIQTGNVIVTGGGFTTSTFSNFGGTFNGFQFFPTTTSRQSPNFQQVATFVSASATADSPAITATYSIDAPVGSSFPLGVYTIAVNSPAPTVTIDPVTLQISTVTPAGTPVTDVAGTPLPIQRIGQFEISNQAPIPSANAPEVTAPGSTGADFTVTYSAQLLDGVTQLDVSHSIIGTNGDITVTTPSGQVLPAFITAVADPVDPTTGLIETAAVTYHIDAPGGRFTSASNGTYSIVLGQDKIGDTGGNNNFTPAGTIGSLAVNVPTVVGFTQTSQSVLETSASPTVVTVTRDGATDLPLTLNYAVSGTAIAGSNYAALTGVVTIPAGSTSADIDIQPLLTTEFTADRVLTLTLQPQNGVQLNANTSDTITITEVAPPVVTVANVTANEPLFDTSGNLVFTVVLSKVWGAAVTVPVATSNGTALAGANYVSTQSTLSFAPGQTAATVTVPLIGDLVNKANLTFNLNVGTPTNATQGNNIAIGTIVNLPLRTVNFNSLKPLTYLDTFGNSVTATISGPGGGTLIFRGDTRQPTDALELFTHGTTTNTVLTISAKKQTTIKIVHLTDLAAFNAGPYSVTSSMAVNGSVTKIQLGSLQKANVTFSQGFVAPSLTVGTVQNSSIASQVPFKALQFTKWNDTDATPDTISAPGISSLKVSQNFSADVTVDGDLGPVTIGGALSGSVITAAVDVGDVTVNTAANSSINAGEEISSFTVKSKGANAFRSTSLRALLIDDVVLGTINPNNGGVEFGIFAGTLNSVSGKLPASGPFNFDNPVVVDNATLISEVDFVILLQG